MKKSEWAGQEMTEYRIPDYNLEELKATIERLAKKAAKLGTAKIELVVTGYEDVEDHDLVKRVYLVTVTGETPKLNGWELVAKLEHLSGGNILRVLPGKGELPKRFRDVGPWCEYCKTNRDRKDTYVVRHDDGKYQQVGSTCLADFTGHRNPEAAVRAAEYIWGALEAAERAADDEYGCGGGRAPVFKIESFLAWTAMIIRQYGWESRSKALYGCGTADRAATAILDKARDKARPQEKDVELAGKALAWAREELATRDGLNDYEWNLVRTTEGDAIEDRWIGYVASVIPAYQRENEKKVETGESKHQGEVGKRSEFNGLKVVNISYFSGQYGTTAVHKFVDGNGNVYTWFSSSEDLERGEVYSGKATVKKHDEYRGVKQTVLTRCKFEMVSA